MALAEEAGKRKGGLDDWIGEEEALGLREFWEAECLVRD